MTLTEAITAVETAATAYSNTVATTKSDVDAAASIQAKLDAANAAVATDRSTQAAAAKMFNEGLDTLISTATAH